MKWHFNRSFVKRRQMSMTFFCTRKETRGANQPNRIKTFKRKHTQMVVLTLVIMMMVATPYYTFSVFPVPHERAILQQKQPDEGTKFFLCFILSMSSIILCVKHVTCDIDQWFHMQRIVCFFVCDKNILFWGEINAAGIKYSMSMMSLVWSFIVVCLNVIHNYMLLTMFLGGFISVQRYRKSSMDPCKYL